MSNHRRPLLPNQLLMSNKQAYFLSKKDEDICHTKVTSLAGLQRHKEAIHEKLKFECEKCGKSFCQKSTMKRHIKIVHEGFVPYKCKECDNTFTKKQYLNDHVLMVHRGINPYVCDFCDKVFTQAHMMKTHIKNKTCQRK